MDVLDKRRNRREITISQLCPGTMFIARGMYMLLADGEDYAINIENGDIWEISQEISSGDALYIGEIIVPLYNAKLIIHDDIEEEDEEYATN